MGTARLLRILFQTAFWSFRQQIWIYLPWSLRYERMEILAESAAQLSDPETKLHLRHWPVDVLQHMIDPMWHRPLDHFPKLLCMLRSAITAGDVHWKRLRSRRASIRHSLCTHQLDRLQEQDIQALQQWLTFGPGNPLMIRLDVQILTKLWRFAMAHFRDVSRLRCRESSQHRISARINNVTMCAKRKKVQDILEAISPIEQKKPFASIAV